MALKKGETLDLETLEIVPVKAAEEKKPEAKKEDEKPDEEEDPKEEEDKKGAEEKKPDADEKKKDGEEEEKESGDDKEKETEGKEKPGEEKKPDKKDEEERKPEEVNSTISSLYEEKYGIKTQEELDEVLETVGAVAAKNKELEEALKDKKPEFATESQQKAFDFIKNLDPSKFGDGLQTYGRLLTIDPEKDDARIVMEEAFILDHPEFTREEAQRKFNRDYNKQYSTPSKEDFEDEDELKEEEDDRKLRLKSAEAKARKVIKEKQKEFKASDKGEKAKPVVNEEVETAIKKTGKVYSESLDQMSELVFSPTDDEEDDFSCKFSQDELKNIRAVCETFVKNPAAYTEKGVLKEKELDAEKLFKRVAYYLYGDKIVEKMSGHLEDVYSVKRAEEIGKHKPDRKPKLPSASKPVLTEEEQLDALIKQKEKNKSKRRPVAA